MSKKFGIKENNFKQPNTDRLYPLTEVKICHQKNRLKDRQNGKTIELIRSLTQT